MNSPEDVFPTQEDTEAFVAENKAAKLTRKIEMISKMLILWVVESILAY